MKFTEGYWLRSEKVKASYAAQAFTVEKIPHGMRITAPERPILSRADALDQTVLLIDFVSAGHNDIAVTATHYTAYDAGEPRFELHEDPDPVKIHVTAKEAVMTAGDITVRVDREHWGYRFEAGGRLLTSSGARNLGYMRWDGYPSTMMPAENYLTQDYEPHMVNELSLAPGECVYGLGERFTSFVKNGQVVEMWNEDGGTASQISYKNIPFYMTNNGYGVFVDHSGPVSFEVASEKVEYVGFSVKGEQLRYHLFYGKTPADILEAYTNLTGRPALPPEWTFGLWLSTCFKPMYDEKTVTGMIDGMQKRHIPFRVFHFDCYWMKALHWCDFEWDEKQFSDVEGMLARYHAKGLKICAWINPYVAQNTKMFEEGVKHGYFLLRDDGLGVKQVDNWQPGLAIVDFTNPDAVKWYQGKLKKVLDAGVDCFKTDFGERIPTDVSYFDGSDPETMHNYYTFLYNRTVFELIKKVRGEGEAVVFARSATAGSQQFPVHWGGDCFASYPSMAETLRGGLSFAMSGFSFWSHDISGFESTASPDLYKRWLAFGIFSTHSRLHGSDTYRVPWLFDEEACEVARVFSSLKNTLMPYIFRQAVTSHEKGTPVMRPMPFVYPEDPACSYLDQQYMFGDSLLVSPIFNEEGIGRYYLPAGKWENLFDGSIEEGGRWHEEHYDYLHMPVFVKQNSLIAVGAEDSRPDYDYVKGVTLHYYLPVSGESAVAEIPDSTGRIVFTAKAQTDESGKITITVSDPAAKAKYVIHTQDGKTIKGVLSAKTTHIK
ncbi:MAG: alpha-xylosidase [Lachnospiraceae bacterium]|jgi:alpha-D-xyloside xylohydrolase|nr:alpha-xylosidase [Lachnospiraceae bacterium]